MRGATRHRGPLHATEELVRAAFSEEAYTSLTEADGNRPDSVALFQKQFKTTVQLARQQFEALRSTIENWRERVCRGEVDFAESQEECFKGELRTFTVVADLLNETYLRFQPRGILLSHPQPVGIVLNHKKDAQIMLDSWKSPEWEVTGMRTVKWDKEQTEYLLAKLGSCE